MSKYRIGARDQSITNEIEQGDATICMMVCGDLLGKNTWTDGLALVRTPAGYYDFDSSYKYQIVWIERSFGITAYNVLLADDERNADTLWKMHFTEAIETYNNIIKNEFVQEALRW